MKQYYMKRIIFLLLMMSILLLNGNVSFGQDYATKDKNNAICIKYVDCDLTNKCTMNQSDLRKDRIIKNKSCTCFRIQKNTIYFYSIFIFILLIYLNLIFFKNILKLRKAEKQFKKEKQILQSVIDSAAHGILVADEDWRVIHYNQGFRKMWKVPRGVMYKKCDRDIVNYVKDQLIDPNEFVARTYEISRRTRNIVDVIHFKDGRIFERGYQPLIIDGKPSGMVWNFRDITRKRELEELQREIELKERLLEEAKKYDKIKTQFFATISHELKTPLNIILGVAQLTNEICCKNKLCADNNKLNKYINISKQNCYRLLKLINNLIDITKIDSGYMEMNFKNYNIVSVIENITLSVAEYVESKGIELIFDTEIEEKIIACDIEKLERVMLNLFSNAIKFTESNGAINVNIYEQGESILICVKDTGIGIPENMKEKIFDRFRQVDSSLQRRAEGSGIGLSLVKSIIEMHNGSIKIESHIGKGSEFIIEFPVSVVDENFDTQQEIAVASEPNVERISVEFSDIYE